MADVCRKHNCSERSFYRWKAKFGGMDVAEAKRLEELERENADLKKIVADQPLDMALTNDLALFSVVLHRKPSSDPLNSRLRVV